MERRGRAMRTNSVPAQDKVVRRHKPDYQIVLYMGLLMLLGLIVMYAIGPQRANVLNNLTGTDYGSTYFFFKQSLSLGLALAVFAAMAVIPYHWLKRYGGKILMIGFIACAVLALAGWVHLGIAQCSLGACRWFNLGPLSLQPAELLKFGLLVFMAGFLGMRMKQGKVNDLHQTLIPFGVVALIAIIFVIGIQNDMGTGISLIAILVTMMMAAGLSKKIGIILIVASLILGSLFVVTSAHRRARVATFLEGDSTSQNDASNYHVNNAKIAIGSGGWKGLGIGNSVQATGYLPEAINDSIFAIIGETFGFIGVTLVLILFTALLMRILRVSDHLQEPWMKVCAAGVFGWLGSHVILNVAAMIGVFPLTGITLPLLSFGGTSMIFIAAALGIVFQFSRYTMHGSLNKETEYENSGSWRRVGGPRYTGRRSTPRA